MGTTVDLNEHPVEIIVPGTQLLGTLTVPSQARGVILFAHGTGSSRFSKRDQFVSKALNEDCFATLLLDLLCEKEDGDPELIFDIELLAERLMVAADWLKANPLTSKLPLGLFGASTGAAAALVSAARRPEMVRALVCRGGRPDLADAWLPLVEAPTLLIVGSLDCRVVQLNESARGRMECVCDLIEVKGASHLFMETGAMEQVSNLARQWYIRHLNGEEDWS
jgi:pimeloyl-ACP methyl ester carboxylesterase